MTTLLPIRYAAAAAFMALVGAIISDRACAQVAEASSADHPLGEHPAIVVNRLAPSVDTNRLILMHPAQLMVVDAPTRTYDHPAITIQRLSRDAAVYDRYMAGPPVASAWLRHAPLAAAVQTTASR